MPFSDCRVTETDGSTKVGAIIGIPMPRFAYMLWEVSELALDSDRTETESEDRGPGGGGVRF